MLLAFFFVEKASQAKINVYFILCTAHQHLYFILFNLNLYHTLKSSLRAALFPECSKVERGERFTEDNVNVFYLIHNSNIKA